MIMFVGGKGTKKESIMQVFLIKMQLCNITKSIWYNISMNVTKKNITFARRKH